MENSRRGDMYGMVMLGLQVETLAMAAVTTHAPAASFVAAAACVGPCGPGGPPGPWLTPGSGLALGGRA